MLTIRGNQPLNCLLEKFRILCHKHESRTTLPADFTSHDKVLKIFNDALAMAGSPTDDAAMPYDCPLNANDEDEPALHGQIREKSSLDPSNGPRSTEAYSLQVETGSLAVDHSAGADADELKIVRATARARPQVQRNASSPQLRHSGCVAFAASSSAPSCASRGKPVTQPTNGRLSSGRPLKGNAAMRFRDTSLKLAARRRGLSSRLVSGRRAPPSEGPSRRSEQPTVAKPRQARTTSLAAPAPLLAPVRRSRSQMKAAATTSSQDEATRTKRTRSADDDEHSATNAAKRAKRWTLSTLCRGKGKQRAT